MLCAETLRFSQSAEQDPSFSTESSLETAEPDQVLAICECIYNIIHDNIPIPEGIKEELASRKQMLWDLADTNVPYKIKKEILLQIGGSILGALILPAISAILGFVNNSKK